MERFKAFIDAEGYIDTVNDAQADFDKIIAGQHSTMRSSIFAALAESERDDCTAKRGKQCWQFVLVCAQYPKCRHTLATWRR